MALCNSCVAVFSEPLSPSSDDRLPSSISHHQSITDAMVAIQNGCVICSRMFELLGTENQLMLRNRTGDISHSASALTGTRLFSRLKWVKSEPPTPVLSISMRLNFACGYRDEFTFNEERSELGVIDNALSKLRIQFLPTSCMGIFPQQPIQSKHTGSGQTLDTIKGWLGLCAREHPKCALPRVEFNFYPGRLLDLERLTGKVCLVETHQLVEKAPYITLSHRWGSQRCVLTVDNRQQLDDGIALESLPKKYQDAVTVAKHLSIRYIWVDSLCIIQEGDNSQDWEMQCKVMDQIYSNAYLNLAADEASETDGLFFARDPNRLPPFQLKIHIENAAEFEEWAFIDADMWINQVNQSLLNQRGWVFQERLLANKVVHFCRHQIFWECREKSLCESFPKELPLPQLFDLGDSASMRRFELWEGSTRLQDPNFPHSDVLYEVWDDMIKKYSGCQLTDSTDRLYAISGVAKHLKPAMQDQYIVGMWSKHLVAELAWWIYPHREQFILGQELPYFAPSFSWASVKGEINSFGPFLTGFLVSVEFTRLPSGDKRANPPQLTEDIFDQPRRLAQPNLAIKVECTIKQVWLRKIENRWCMATLHQVDKSAKQVPSNRFYFFADLDFIVPESKQASFESAGFYLVPWRNGPDGSNDYTDPASVHGMLLQLVDLETGTFRRIGWMQTEVSYKKKEILEEDKVPIFPLFYNIETDRSIVYII